jgi:transcriptional regulator GlxA family with amidase domain
VVVEARVVDSGNLIMAGGVTAGIDLALWIVEREFGTGIADTVTEEIEYPRSRDVWRREPQRPELPLPSLIGQPSADPSVRHAWRQANGQKCRAPMGIC